jgi:hypothetical protein
VLNLSLLLLVQAIAAGDVSLVVLETGSFESFDRSILKHRLEADLTMLMSYGDGKERDEQQTRALFTAGGFTMGKISPTNGLMAVIEAVPTPASTAAAVTPAVVHAEKDE